MPAIQCGRNLNNYRSLEDQLVGVHESTEVCRICEKTLVRNRNIMNKFLGVHKAGWLAKVCKTCEGTSVWNGNVADRSLGVHEADRNCDNCLDGMNDREEVVSNDDVMDGPSGNEEVPEDGDVVFEGRGRMGCV